MDNFIYRCERVRKTRSYWLCIRYKSSKCNGRIICHGNNVIKRTVHCHPNDQRRISASILEEADLSVINLDEWYKQTLVHHNKQHAFVKHTTISTTLPVDGDAEIRTVSFRDDLQDQLIPEAVQYIRSRRGHPLLIFRGYKFRRNGCCKEKGYWRCASFSKCPGRVTTIDGIIVKYHAHNHDPPFVRREEETFLIRRPL